MTIDAPTIFARLAEREKKQGHHSAEGSAIRTLCRALTGWSSGSLSPEDVLSLCRQAIEDWLKARLKISGWSSLSLPQLAEAAAEKGLLSAEERAVLIGLDLRRASHDDAPAPTDAEVGTALERCIEVVEKRWL